MEEIKPIKIEGINIQNFKYEEPEEKLNIVYPKWNVVFKDENTIIMKTNPKEWLKARIKEMNNIDKDFDIPWIKVDSNVEPEYKIIKKSSHDGTLMFTGDIIAKTLEPLFNMTSCYAKTKPSDESKVKAIYYIVGDLELKSEFGMVDLPIGRYPGQTDTVTIPVRCEYIFK